MRIIHKTIIIVLSLGALLAGCAWAKGNVDIKRESWAFRMAPSKSGTFLTVRTGRYARVMFKKKGPRPAWVLVSWSSSISRGPTVIHRVWIHFPLPVACGLLAVYPATAFIRGPLRKYRRRRKGLCVGCGYDLTGNESGVCPECGMQT